MKFLSKIWDAFKNVWVSTAQPTPLQFVASVEEVAPKPAPAKKKAVAKKVVAKKTAQTKKVPAKNTTRRKK